MALPAVRMVRKVGYVPEVNVRSTLGTKWLRRQAETETSRDRNTKAVDDGCTVDTRERRRSLGRQMVRDERRDWSNMPFEIITDETR